MKPGTRVEIRNFIGGVLAIVMIVVLIKVALDAADKRPSSPQPVAAEPRPEPLKVVFVPDASTIWPELAGGVEIQPAPTTVAEAITRYRPLMDEKPGESSVGTMAFAMWATGQLRWRDVAMKKLNETIPARVRKDVEAERGKQFCMPPARVIQIRREKVSDASLFVGLLYLDDEVIHFYAVRSTGTIVEGNDARFCGIVTGILNYTSDSGRKIHATELVGMFDLPENRHD